MNNDNVTQEAAQEATIQMDSLTVMIQGGVVLKHDTSIFLRVTYKVHEAIRGKDFDEHYVPEYLEILRVRTGYNVVLTNADAGIRLELRPNADVGDILTEYQLSTVRMNLKKQARGTITTPQRSTFVTSDNLRLPEDDAIKTQLGHNLLREYKR